MRRRSARAQIINLQKWPNAISQDRGERDATEFDDGKYARLVEMYICRLCEFIADKIPGQNHELIHSKRDLPAGIPNRIVQILKRVRHFPIWMMGPNFPDNPWSMLDQLRPSMQGDKIFWHHHPSRSKPRWRGTFNSPCDFSHFKFGAVSSM
jgi:hypothetical protein